MYGRRLLMVLTYLHHIISMKQHLFSSFRGVGVEKRTLFPVNMDIRLSFISPIVNESKAWSGVVMMAHITRNAFIL